MDSRIPSDQRRSRFLGSSSAGVIQRAGNISAPGLQTGEGDGREGLNTVDAVVNTLTERSLKWLIEIQKGFAHSETLFYQNLTEFHGYIMKSQDDFKTLNEQELTALDSRLTEFAVQHKDQIQAMIDSGNENAKLFYTAINEKGRLKAERLKTICSAATSIVQSLSSPTGDLVK